MVDYCARCSRNVNLNSDPYCYDLSGACLCKKCRDKVLKEELAPPGRERKDAGGLQCG
jgi:hypothetical protein